MDIVAEAGLALCREIDPRTPRLCAQDARDSQ